VAFSWKVLQDRIPTKINLARRNVLQPGANLNRALCNDGEDSSSHIFLHCDVVFKVWDMFVRWLNIYFIISHNFFVHYVGAQR
jgi:hypothetical protein